MSSTDNVKFSWIDLARAIWHFVGNKRPQFVLWTILLAICNLYTLAPFWVIGMIVDFFNTYKPGDSLMPFYLYTFGLGISWGIFMTLRLTTKQNLGNLRADFTYNVRVEGFERLLDYSLEWHDEEVTGNKIQRIANGTEALTNLNKYFYGEIFQSVTNIIGIIIAFAAIQPIFLLFLVIYIASLLFIQYFFYCRILFLPKHCNESRERPSWLYYEGLNK